MKLMKFAAMACAICIAAPVSAGQFGVLSDAAFKNPDHPNDMTDWAVNTATQITTNLTEGFSGSLSVEFAFDFDPGGDKLNLAFVLPTRTDGLNVYCTNQREEVYYISGSEFAKCTISGDWIDTIDSPRTIELDFLGGGGTAGSVPTLTWNINPYVAPPPVVVPLNVETISVDAPVSYGEAILIGLTLNQPAQGSTDVTVGLTPTDCFRSLSRRDDPLADPVYLLQVVNFAAGQNYQVIPVQTKLCNSRSFIVRTWMGSGPGVTRTADPTVTANAAFKFARE